MEKCVFNTDVILGFIDLFYILMEKAPKLLAIYSEQTDKNKNTYIMSYLDWLIMSVSQKQEFERLMSDIVLSCPLDGKPQVITNIENEDGAFVIYTEGEDSNWKHKLYTEEI